MSSVFTVGCSKSTTTQNRSKSPRKTSGTTVENLRENQTKTNDWVRQCSHREKPYVLSLWIKVDRLCLWRYPSRKSPWELTRPLQCDDIQSFSRTGQDEGWNVWSGDASESIHCLSACGSTPLSVRWQPSRLCVPVGVSDGCWKRLVLGCVRESIHCRLRSTLLPVGVFRKAVIIGVGVGKPSWVDLQFLKLSNWIPWDFTQI